MTDSANPIFHYAVLVPVDFAEVNGTQPWAVHYANGDLASARAKAEEWAACNPGQRAVVVQYVDDVQIVTQTKWGRA